MSLIEPGLDDDFVVKRKLSRAEKAGRALGESIVEMIHLMYQKNTAKNFWRGLMDVLNGNLP